MAAELTTKIHAYPKNDRKTPRKTENVVQNKT